jgi:lipopolysaccharide transport system ATP-binding protein
MTANHMSNSVIKVSNLSKRYRLGLKEKQAKTLAGQMANMIKAPWENLKRLREMSRFGVEDESVFWALKDVNFEVKEGEVLGIIGKNGAGKSTLLKILSQITEPTSGRIKIHGRVASLLEVGTGFHPELSGRENIYMNGTILGMTRREIDSKLDEIVDFSGIEKFLDTPVKFYSSGMKVRLGFSVAAHLEPEILIIDEVLAVGDFEFQKKCLGKMEDVSRNQGRTVLFVSHDLVAVKNLCTKAILLDSGIILGNGDVSKTIDFYLSRAVTSSQLIDRNENKDIFLQSFKIISEAQTGSPFEVEATVFSKRYSNVQFATTFKTLAFQPLFQIYSGHSGVNFKLKPGSNRILFSIESLPLIHSEYRCNIWIGSNGQKFDFLENAFVLEVKEGAITKDGPISSFNGYPVIGNAKWNLL